MEHFRGGAETGESKSAEQMQFEELLADSGKRSLEGNYTSAETAEDEKRIHQESMRGAYLESGDPKKMAMFNLLEAKTLLGSLAMSLDTLETWDEDQKKKGIMERAEGFVKGWKKGWEDGKNENTAKLEPILRELGLEMPQTSEAARDLKSNIVNSENMQKLSEKYQAESRGGRA